MQRGKYFYANCDARLTSTANETINKTLLIDDIGRRWYFNDDDAVVCWESRLIARIKKTGFNFYLVSGIRSLAS